MPTRRENHKAKENSLSKFTERMIYQRELDDDYSTKQGGLNTTLTATTNYTTRNMQNSTNHNITTTNNNNNLNNTQLYESNFELNSCNGAVTDLDRSYQHIPSANASNIGMGLAMTSKKQGKVYCNDN